MTPCIVWFRQDLRLHDNPALKAALQHEKPIIPLYILDDTAPGPWKIGRAQRWWLHHSLQALDKSMEGHLVLRAGPAEKVLKDIIHETKATHVFWNRCYEPWRMAGDKSIKENLQKEGIEVASFNGCLLFEPWTIYNTKKEPYRVFTQFWKKCLAASSVGPCLKTPAAIGWADKIVSEPLESWGLLPTHPNWAKGFNRHWQPGEKGALSQADAFFEESLANYKQERNRPDRHATSRLSPHLHFGEISVRLLWERLHHISSTPSQGSFLNELGWREFCYHLLYHFPDLPHKSFRPAFEAFPWSSHPDKLSRWQRGQTGYPIVDAGMGQLWATGWMHNRVRMIVASFLIKDLLIEWREGQTWFWDTLVDADLANNAGNWQWVAGSGADAAPYFRIFNPILQGEKFDPQGHYVKEWVPALKNLSEKWIHRPFEAPSSVLKEAGITLGRDYPYPVVDRSQARTQALEAFKAIKQI